MSRVYLAILIRTVAVVHTRCLGTFLGCHADSQRELLLETNKPIIPGCFSITPPPLPRLCLF